MKTTCWSSNRASERGRKGFKWLWTWNGCGARRAGLSISKTADLLGFSHTTISKVYREWSEKEKISRERQLCGWKCLVDVRGQRRMDRLVRDDRKATVTQITTRYNQGMQNTSLNTQHVEPSSRRPHRVPLLSDKNRTRRIQFTQDPQNSTIEDWKNVAWSDESRFLLRHSDGRVRIWCKEHQRGKGEVLTNTDLDRFVNNIWEKQAFCVHRKSLRSLSSAHEKQKGCIYNLVQCLCVCVCVCVYVYAYTVYTHTFIYIYIYIYIYKHRLV